MQERGNVCAYQLASIWARERGSGRNTKRYAVENVEKIGFKLTDLLLTGRCKTQNGITYSPFYGLSLCQTIFQRSLSVTCNDIADTQELRFCHEDRPGSDHNGPLQSHEFLTPVPRRRRWPAAPGPSRSQSLLVRKQRSGSDGLDFGFLWGRAK